MITLTLEKVEDTATGTKTFYFNKPDNFQFRAGQYVALKVDQLVAPDTRAGVRSLSICAAPCESQLIFTMRQSESGFKQTFWAMEPGATVSVTPPIGKFVLEPGDTRTVVYLVGGVGITPVRSQLIEEAQAGSERHFVLFNANRKEEDAPHREELKSLKLAHFQYVDVFSQEERELLPGEVKGYINKELLEASMDNPKECVYYIVGSPSFLEAMENMLHSLEVPEDQWHKDPFTGMDSANVIKK
ncbi:MAG: FAD-dependent oxidoreductase [Candidatus Moranbacteria bacterium]|nr:FAD-dependent oxidoreductase [Candidatus Moranbacteria bacterium]